MSQELLVRNVRHLDGSTVDLLAVDGRIRSVEAGATASSPEATVLDGGNRLLFPGLVDMHAHHDKSMLGLPWYRRRTGPRSVHDVRRHRSCSAGPSRHLRAVDAHWRPTHGDDTDARGVPALEQFDVV